MEPGELVNLAAVERVMLALALGGPVAGLLLGLGWGAARNRSRTGALQGAALGALGPAAWLLWRIYNTIEDHYGLDSVRALLFNLALFVVVGVAAGVLYQVFGVRDPSVGSDTGRSPSPPNTQHRTPNT